MKSRPASSVKIMEVPSESRESLLPILDQSFTGLYRWHAKRTLRSVRWVKVASRDGEQAGLSMLTMLAGRVGYVYYIAVRKSQRSPASVASFWTMHWLPCGQRGRRRLLPASARRTGRPYGSCCLAISQGRALESSCSPEGSRGPRSCGCAWWWHRASGSMEERFEIESADPTDCPN